MGGALILIASGDHQSNNDSDQYQQTFYAAEMGLLEGERYILNQKNGPWDNATNARDLTKAICLKKIPQNLLGKCLKNIIQKNQTLIIKLTPPKKLQNNF